MTATNAHRFDFPNEESRDLCRSMLMLETVEDFENFLRDLCTIQELKEMTERWSIAKMVWENCPYRVITQKTGASSTTIARVAHWLTYGKGGYQKVCELRGKQSVNKEVSPVFPATGIHALPR